MATKPIKTYTSDDGTKQVRVYRDSELGEWVARFYKLRDGTWRHREAADYHADSREDALQTAFAMAGSPQRAPVQPCLRGNP